MLSKLNLDDIRQEIDIDIWYNIYEFGVSFYDFYTNIFEIHLNPEHILYINILHDIEGFFLREFKL